MYFFMCHIAFPWLGAKDNHWVLPKRIKSYDPIKTNYLEHINAQICRKVKKGKAINFYDLKYFNLYFANLYYSTWLFFSLRMGFILRYPTANIHDNVLASLRDQAIQAENTASSSCTAASQGSAACSAHHNQQGRGKGNSELS